MLVDPCCYELAALQLTITAWQKAHAVCLVLARLFRHAEPAKVEFPVEDQLAPHEVDIIGHTEIVHRIYATILCELHQLVHAKSI